MLPQNLDLEEVFFKKFKLYLSWNVVQCMGGLELFQTWQVAKKILEAFFISTASYINFFAFWVKYCVSNETKLTIEW